MARIPITNVELDAEIENRLLRLADHSDDRRMRLCGRP
jgi:hypothetical protein